MSRQHQSGGNPRNDSSIKGKQKDNQQDIATFRTAFGAADILVLRIVDDQKRAGTLRAPQSVLPGLNLQEYQFGQISTAAATEGTEEKIASKINQQERSKEEKTQKEEIKNDKRSQWFSDNRGHHN